MTEATPDLDKDTFVRGMLGSTRRIEVLTAIAKRSIDPPERFFPNQIHNELAAGSDIRRIHTNIEIGHLEKLGMITRIDEPRKSRQRVDYVRVDSPAWEIAEVAIRVVGEMFPAPTEVK